MALNPTTDLVREDPPADSVAEKPDHQPERNRLVMTFRALCGKQVLPMWLLESDHMTLLAANEAAVQLSGYGRVDGSVGAEIIFPELDTRRLRLSEPLRTVLSTHTGLKHDVELTPSVAYFAGSSVVFVVGRRMKDFLESQAQTRDRDRYLDIANVAIVVTDARELVLHWNQCAAELYGWKEDEVIGQPLRNFLAASESAEAARRALVTGQKWEGRDHAAQSAGQIAPHSQPLEDAAGRGGKHEGHRDRECGYH